MICNIHRVHCRIVPVGADLGRVVSFGVEAAKVPGDHTLLSRILLVPHPVVVGVIGEIAVLVGTEG